MTGDAARLTQLINALLPRGVGQILAALSRAAQQTGGEPHLVGGTVRDLLLGRAHADIDLTVVGDAPALAAAAAAALGAVATAYPEFGTATLHLPWARWEEVGDEAARLPDARAGLHVDLAATRTEHYARPGALPVVWPGASLAADLQRRDFTLNAMAVGLVGSTAGELVDPTGGADDLAAGRLAVLHEASFADDPTRLARGARLAGRLWLRFAPDTEALARAAVAGGWLAALSGERRRHELAMLLDEAQPAAALALARRHGILEQLHPALRWDEWLAERLQRSTAWAALPPRAWVRLALLAYRWPPATIDDATASLQLDKKVADALLALPVWHERKIDLPAATRGSQRAALLAGLPAATLAAARLAEDEPAIIEALDWYASEGRALRPRLGGEALRQLGLPPGPTYRPILAELRAAVQDGLLPDEAAEWDFLRRRLTGPDAGIESAGEEGRQGDADAEL